MTASDSSGMDMVGGAFSLPITHSARKRFVFVRGFGKQQIGRVATHDAHALAVFEIDRRIKDHGRQLRKLLRSCAPAPCDFSG